MRNRVTSWLLEPQPMKSETLLDKAKITLVVAVIVAVIFGVFYAFGWLDFSYEPS